MDIKDLSLRKADIAEGEVATAPSSENNTRKIQCTDILLFINDGGELWTRLGKYIKLQNVSQKMFANYQRITCYF